MSNHCSCPNPPGGDVTCQTNEIAYCKVVAGLPHSGCLPKPTLKEDGGRSIPEDTLAWVLREIGFDMMAPIYVSLGPELRVLLGSREASFALRKLLDPGMQLTAFGRTALRHPFERADKVEATIRFPNRSAEYETGNG